MQKFIKLLAKQIVKKYKPKIVGITGSVGKTGTKEMAGVVLSRFFRVRESNKDIRGELGLIMSILGLDKVPASFFAWVKVLFVALGQVLSRKEDYPQVLILEMPADRPGDIKNFLKIVKCDVGVITAVGPTHLRSFDKIESVLKEKKAIISHLTKSGVAVLNKDDQLVWPLEKETQAEILTFGFSIDAKIQADNFTIEWQPENIAGDFRGVRFNLIYDHKSLDVFLPNVLGKQQVYNALAAVGIGLALELDLDKIIEAFKDIKPINGRMRLLDGVKKSLLIDDSYNSSPVDAQMAVDVLGDLSCSGEKFAVLGDMLELGPYSEEAHQELGRRVVKNNIDYLVTVGELGKEIANSARKTGMREAYVYSFGTCEDAGKFVQDRIEPGDLLLIKGSKGMNMERIVKELMAEPLRAGELLVRQDLK